MRAYSNMQTEDFVYQLRQIAIDAKASPLVIDQIDNLAAYNQDEVDKECEAAFEKGEEAERDEWRGRLDDAIASVDDMDFDDPQRAALVKLLADIDPLS